MLLILAALGAMLFGCGGSGGSAQSSGQEGQRASQSAGSSEQKTAGGSKDEQATKERLGHPSFGSAEAPVVLTEYGDYQ
jgi:protein-disulfide isomerase